MLGLGCALHDGATRALARPKRGWGCGLVLVRELCRYPVKSMQGERVSEGQIGARGIAHDRGYALLDTETGKIAEREAPSAVGHALRCRASVASERGGEICALLSRTGSELLTHPDDAGVDKDADQAFLAG